MYDIKWIREHPGDFDRGLERRGLEPLSGKLLALDERRRALITKLEQAQARRNAASKEIGQAKAKKDEAAAAKLMAEVAEFKTSIPDMEAKEKEASAALEKELAQIPNMPADDVPDGKDASANVERHAFGKKRDYAFKPKQHFELGEALGMMDFELAVALSGARFVILQKGLARMERALGQFMLDLHTGPVRIENDVEIGGYTEISPPLLVRQRSMFGTAQLPKFVDDQYRAYAKTTLNEAAGAFVEDVDVVRDEKTRLQEAFEKYWLIPTAEVPLTNFVREQIVEEEKLPMRLTACTPCFRAEAGAAGKDTRGMIRQHQFTKVELVSIVTPEKSKEEHERMLACAEEVLKKLDLHYRVVTLCTGDMGFAAQKTYDIEVWLPGQNAYREISSCSNCGEFQARRMQARYKGKDGKVKGPVHTLNGSGVAVGRALIAVMETYQQADGSILVPEALKDYMGGMTKIERA
jgi:seryl-tRNA synthetase